MAPVTIMRYEGDVRRSKLIWKILCHQKSFPINVERHPLMLLPCKKLRIPNKTLTQVIDLLYASLRKFQLYNLASVLTALWKLWNVKNFFLSFTRVYVWSPERINFKLVLIGLKECHPCWWFITHSLIWNCFMVGTNQMDQMDHPIMTKSKKGGMNAFHLNCWCVPLSRPNNKMW